MTDRTWFSVPEAADLLGLRQRDVRQLAREGRLLLVAHPESGARGVPGEFLVETDGARSLLPSLPGTLTVLADAGVRDDDAAEWLWARNDELGTTPIEALRAGQIHAVRRAAALAI